MPGSLKARWESLLEDHPRLETGVTFLSKWTPPINFITIHYSYFVFGSLLASLIFWGSCEPHGSIDYIDCLFLSVSALTDTGLNTVNLSELTTWQQVQIWILCIIGSAIWVSWWTVMARKHAFENRFDNIVRDVREKGKKRRVSQNRVEKGPALRQIFSLDKFSRFKSSPPAINILPGLGTRQSATEKEMDTLTAVPESPSEPIGVPVRRAVSAPEEDIPSDMEDNASRATTISPEARPASAGDHISFAPTLRRPNADGGSTSAYQPGEQLVHRVNVHPPSTVESVGSSESDDDDWWSRWRQIMTKENTSKRGQVYDLSSDEREELGGCEYRALKVLAIAVPLYGFAWQFLCAIALATWLANNAPEAAAASAQNPYWTGVFLSVSAFNNLGMSLLDAGMTAFQSQYFPLIVVGILILAGNTAYPLFLRLIFWTMLKVLKLTTDPSTLAPWKETIEFILKYPRRVYTTLFPSRPTWWLLGILFLINVIDWVAFEVLNIGNPIIEAMPTGDRIVAGWFQAVAVRAAGFACVSISSLYPGVQLLYVIMMYISIYPVTITMRHSNVYEERSLGIYEDDPAVLEQDLEMGGNNDNDENGSNRNNDAGNSNSDFLTVPGDAPTRTALRRVATGATVLSKGVGKGINKGFKHAMTFHGVGVRPPPKSPDDNSRVSFIGQQIRGQLAHDMWWLVLPLLLIIIIETDHFLDQPLTYSVFNILLEVVSAYGCVGLSVGVPNNSYSFSGGWHRGSKFVLCLVMLRGRHRGLPVALDKAVRLPGENLAREEEEDSRIRRTKALDRIASRDVSRDLD